MTDIFGWTVNDYKTLKAFNDNGILQAQLQARCRESVRRGIPYDVAVKAHNFQAFDFGSDRSVNLTASGALGYITNNFQAFVSMTDEIWYREHRLPEFVPVVNGGIAEGADSYAVIVRDRVGRGRLAGRHGSRVPTADDNIRRYSANLYLGEIDATYTEEDMRNSLMANVPLQQNKIRDAVEGANDHLEMVGFQGDPDIGGSTGLFNQTTSGTNPVAKRFTIDDGTVDALKLRTTVPTLTATDNWEDFNADEMLESLAQLVGSIIVNTNEIIVRRSGELCIVMPPDIFNITSTKRIGVDVSMTVMDHFKAANPWTNRTGRPVMFKSLSEMSTLGTAVSGSNNSTRRIAIYVKDPQIMEMRVVFAPRIIRVTQEARATVLPFEYKYSEVQVKRTECMVYLDDI